MKTIGGALEMLPELGKWLAHKITGHPVNQLVIFKGLEISAWCVCGATIPIDQKDRQAILKAHENG